ncbi:MAG TPA: hypothetical protein VN512_10560 [Clostridia bacterium]|nr:hypothetical protein [Clostridia bacterium]
MLDFFGYTKGGKLCVPVYYKKDLEAIREIESVIEAYLFEDVKNRLTSFPPAANLTYGKHSVPVGEIGNELYHILFGFINSELVRRKLVCPPV